MKRIGTLALGLVLLMNLSACEGGSSGPGGPEPFDETTVCILAKDTVKENLKSPSTAKFPDSFCSKVSFTKSVNAEGHTVWLVAGPVDAQKSFGAMLRSTYLVEVTDLGDGDRYRSRLIALE